MSWMEVNGAGWRWVNGLLIPNCNIPINKHVAQSNDNTYLAIPHLHLDLGRSDEFTNFTV